LTTQRNVILRFGSKNDVIVFFDDDFFPHRDYLAAVAAHFASNPDIVLLTGTLLADGIIGPGLSKESAETYLLSAQDDVLDASSLVDVYNGYGCNFALRWSVASSSEITFDENLPLYGWLEDVDFSRRLSRHGRVARSTAAKGVHLGVKVGRQTGVRLGYSQIANPIYLLRKRTMAPSRAFWQMVRNVAMNMAHSAFPEAYVDRRGRLRGNALAVIDLFLGRLHPERILIL
jgi:GT2 family glycosyltransferase